VEIISGMSQIVTWAILLVIGFLLLLGVLDALRLDRQKRRVRRELRQELGREATSGEVAYRMRQEWRRFQPPR
jgi:hypothetical protein